MSREKLNIKLLNTVFQKWLKLSDVNVSCDFNLIFLMIWLVFGCLVFDSLFLFSSVVLGEKENNLVCMAKGNFDSTFAQ